MISRLRLLGGLFSALCLGSVGCMPIEQEDEGPGATLECSANETGAAALECSVIELVNQHRAEGATCSGNPMPPVGPLALHSLLQSSARAHAADMAQNNYFSHDNLAGQSPFDRIEATGYAFSTAAENIAAGNASPAETVGQWMASTAGHCENIMKAKFVHIGVGYAYSPNHQFKHVWVQNFGAPL